MVVIGINASHNATSCLLKDGKIVACISEERITGVKNQSGLPVKSFSEALKLSGISTKEVDLLVFGYEDPKVNTVFATMDVKDRTLAFVVRSLARIKERVLIGIPSSRNLYEFLSDFFYKLFVNERLKEQLLSDVEKKLGISREKVVFVDHHLAHAYSSYYSTPKYWEKPRLVLTLDAMGDGLCSTVSVAKNGKIKKIAETKAGNSIGDLYAFVTDYLGMKMGEHEYKVMGLAPYASEKHGQRIFEKLKGLIWVNKDMTFGSKFYSHMFYKLLPKIFYRERFDNIAYGIQRLTEDILTEWVELCVRKTGIKDISCGGGLFMNVKANQKILGLKDVRSLFIMPSCGDESTAIGAAYWGCEKLKLEKSPKDFVKPVGPLYLGPEYTDGEILAELKKSSYKKLKYTRTAGIEKKIAKLLARGNVVARFSGRMEWGARALGNRSILCHPENLSAIRVINEQIKSRDFWMPFAPSIISEKYQKYIINPKRMEAPYMIVTFDSTSEGREKFRAAMHQYDFTLRPQIVYEDWNPNYWKVLKEFEKLTGIGGVLNTSFNLHGYPIVMSPKDALYVFVNSGLEFLAIGNYLVSK